MTRSLSVVAVFGLGALSFAAAPQSLPSGCRLEESAASPLRIYECQEKLRIAAEAATKLASIEQNGRLVGLRVEGGAVMIETAGTDRFRVETAQAVTEISRAHVAIDAGEGSTAVFVRAGEVSVGRDGASVTLAAGQGVDVPASAPPAPPPPPSRGGASPAARPAPAPVSSASPRSGFSVKTWGQERASALLARLGVKPRTAPAKPAAPAAAGAPRR